jgi:DNA-binding SARP family transcriptional activator/tetratricopeptide (TPR) repeat protein
VEFRVLGPLEVCNEGQSIHLGGPRERTILAMLLLEANRVIPVERLIDAVWNDDPPVTARGQIQICISNLRRRIFAASARDPIETRLPGYRLRLDDGALDLHRFESAVADGRSASKAGDPSRAAVDLRRALGFWRGAALADIESRVVQVAVTQFNERRLEVLAECLDCAVAAGRHRELIGELTALVEEHPLQERFRALLMTSLFRSGRQAEALEVYRRTREVLREELGIEPGVELRRLHQEMLAGEPTGPAPSAQRPAAPAPARVQPEPPARRRAPSLLPADIPDFTGRGQVVKLLMKHVGGEDALRGGEQAVRVSVIVGQGGAGKTTLAVHVAHLLASSFPDGQLFARLRAGDCAVSPGDILERFLRVLGVSGPALPDGLEERAELFRDLLSSRRMLLVFDDAMTEQQVAALMPGTAQCAVIVTSRRRLTGLPSVGRLEIGALSRRSAIELLSRIVGPARIDAERDAVDQLCRLCGDLPLALRICAARLAARPHWSVADLVDRLVDESHRLDELNHGAMEVRASISLTYDGLDEDARCLFRRLALLEAPNFASWVGAPLLGVDVLRAQDALEALTEAYLIDTEPGGTAGQARYRFHDIMRPFARERLAEESADQRRMALERWFGTLLELASEAHRREYAGDFLQRPSGASRWPLPQSLVERLLDRPLAWLDLERASLVASVRQAAASGMSEHAWDLALNAVTLFEAHGYFNDWRETHETALRAARRSGDDWGEAAMRYSLGSLHMFEQRTKESALEFEQAYAAYQRLGDRHGAALVLRNMAFLDHMNGDLESALSRWEEALASFRSVGDRVAEAHVLQHLAQLRLDYGEQDEAYGLLARAATICDEVGNRRVGAQVQHRLGELLLRRGELERAAAAYRRVLEAVREARDRVGECYALLGLSTVDLRRGELDEAAQMLATADELAAEAGERMVASRIALTLAEVTLESGDLPSAALHADRAVTAFDEIGAALYRAKALDVRGRIHRAAGEPDDALEAWRSAHDLLSRLRLDGAVALSQELEAHMSAVHGGAWQSTRVDRVDQTA